MIQVKARFAFTHGAHCFKRDEIKPLPAEVALALERSGHVHVIGPAPQPAKRGNRPRV